MHSPYHLAIAKTSISQSLAEFFRMQESYIPRAHTSFRLDIRFPISVDDRSQIDSIDVVLSLWHGHSYRVIRSPDDLLAHTRRIRLCHEPALNDRLMGAILDLEHVLGTKGNGLLERLKEEAAPILSNLEHSDDPQLAKGRVLPTINQLLQADGIKESPFF